MSKGILRRIRWAVREKRYQMTDHALEEADADNLTLEDVSAWVCPNCGHHYFDADVLAAMEERMKHTPEDARPITGWAMSLPQGV